jgi:ABC-type sugar transport system ATPase subunit
MRGFPKREVSARVDETAKLLGLEGLLKRKPHELSGGQRQRVAMGRAIIRHPQAFLLDEPLSNLDAKLRTQMRTELAKLHRRLGVTTVYVTHDQTEAMTLGSRVAVMRDGVIQQVGAPQELYRRPANAFVGTFIGSPAMNLISGSLQNGTLIAAGSTGRDRIDVSDAWPGENRTVLIGVRPEAWRLAGEGPSRGIEIRGEVEIVEELGGDTIVYFAHEGHRVEVLGEDEEISTDTFAARVTGLAAAAPGERISFHADVADLHLFDAETGEALTRSAAASESHRNDGVAGVETAMRLSGEGREEDPSRKSR